MEKIMTFHGTSTESLAFVTEHLAAFEPIVKLTSFFDNENFILTNYDLSDTSISMIIENDKGNQMQLSSLNCGYGGQGPSATSEVLQLIGVSHDVAEEYRLHSAIEVCLDSRGCVMHTKAPFFAHSANSSSSTSEANFIMDNKSTVDPSIRKVYMVNPQHYNFTGLLNCFKKMRPVALEFFIGRNSPLGGYLRLSDISGLSGNESSCKYTNSFDKINLIIRGELFDLNCFINPDEVIMTANAIHSYLFKRVLYTEKYLGGYVLLQNRHEEKIRTFRNFFKWLFRKNQQDQYIILAMSKEERELWT